MIANNTPKPPHSQSGNFSFPPADNTDNLRINSADLNITDPKESSITLNVQTKLNSVHARRHGLVRLTKSGGVEQFMDQADIKSARAKELSDNLLKHLHTGSNDSLNIMNRIFAFHGYDQTLLRRYINHRTPQNSKALETQIANQLFVVDAQKNVPNRQET